MGQLEGLALHLLAKPSRGLTERRLVTQHRVANARHLVGKRASRLVVIGAPLQLQCPVAYTEELLAALNEFLAPYRKGDGAAQGARPQGVAAG